MRKVPGVPCEKRIFCSWSRWARADSASVRPTCGRRIARRRRARREIHDVRANGVLAVEGHPIVLIWSRNVRQQRMTAWGDLRNFCSRPGGLEVDLRLVLPGDGIPAFASRPKQACDQSRRRLLLAQGSRRRVLLSAQTRDEAAEPERPAQP